MIGNDIVDLQIAKKQSNWQREGFLDKQFTEKEQSEILNAKNPFIYVWLLWSMKEAAYKCYVQEHQQRFFNPKKISCFSVSQTKGIVSIYENDYYTKSTVTSRYIHTIAFCRQNTKVKKELFPIKEKENQSAIIKSKLLSSFSEKMILKKNEIGIPYLYLNEEEQKISFSISHHGNYGAFVILK